MAQDVDDFLDAWVAPDVAQAVHFEQLVDFQWELHAAGLAVVAWPSELGGRNLGPADASFFAQRLGEAGAPELANFVGIEVLAPAVLGLGDRSQHRRWLSGMAEPTEIWCQMFSELDAGSDLAVLGTGAERDGSGWRLTGQKIWSTWGHFAQWGLALARIGSVESRHPGITAFVVDLTAPRVEVRPLRTMTGVAEFAEVFLEGVALPDANVVGALDGGWDVTLYILSSERGPYAVRRAGLIREAVDRAMVAPDDSGRGQAVRWEVLDACIGRFLLDEPDPGQHHRRAAARSSRHDP